MRQALHRIQVMKIQSVLLILAIGLGFGLRLYNLGTAPLSDEEAIIALQAHQIADNTIPNNQIQINPNVAYVALTSILFDLFGSTNFLARFLPALAGGLLILIPTLFSHPKSRDSIFGQLIRPELTIILAFAIALDPGLVTVSRSAGGPMMSLVFTLFAIGFWQIDKVILAGVFTGLAILSGPALIIGGLGILIAWLVYKYLIRSILHPQPKPETEETEEIDDPIYQPKISKSNILRSGKLRTFLISLGCTFLVTGSLFMTLPQGLSAWANGIPIFISGWFSTPEIPASRLIAAILIYELFAISFSLVWVIRVIMGRQPVGERELGLTIYLVLWFVSGLFILLLYPGRQVSLLIWIIIPMLFLAARELSRPLPDQGNRAISIALGSFLAILAALFWYSIAATTRVSFGTSPVNAQYAILIGIIALAGLTIALVALGWQWETSRQGMVLGISFTLLLYSFSVMWGGAHVRHNRAEELWSNMPAPGQVQVMTKVLNEISRWNTGFSNQIDLTSIVDTASLRWALRNFPGASFVASLGNDTLPAVVITSENQQFPALAASYRGEDFVWWENQAWSGALPDDFARWFAFREAPLTKEKIILWSRSDLYPGEEISSGLE